MIEQYFETKSQITVDHDAENKTISIEYKELPIHEESVTTLVNLIKLLVSGKNGITQHA